MLLIASCRPGSKKNAIVSSRSQILSTDCKGDRNHWRSSELPCDVLVWESRENRERPSFERLATAELENADG